MIATVLITTLTLAAPESICGLGSVDRARTLSSACLSCHDGSVGPAVSLTASAPGRGSHPVSVSYALARADVSVHAVGPLDDRLVLPAGRVECVSCHAEDGIGPHKTVVTLRELCGDCHQK